MRRPRLVASANTASIASSNGAAWVVSSKQAGMDRQRKPRVAPALADDAPAAEQRQRPQRLRQDVRTELDGRKCEGRNGERQQHRDGGVLRPDDGAAEAEHRPERDDEADLREQIDAEHVVAGGTEGDVGQPERQRRALHAAEQIFAAIGEVERDVARRAGINQCRQNEPQPSLRERDQPEHQHRPRTDQFDDQGGEAHAVPDGGGDSELCVKGVQRSGNGEYTLR